MKPAAYLVMLAAVCWSAVELDRLDARVRQWTALAMECDLLFADRMLCVIPGWESNPSAACSWDGGRYVIVVYRDTDVDVILTMPDCPVPLAVTTSSQLPEEDHQRLRERFGAENVE